MSAFVFLILCAAAHADPAPEKVLPLSPAERTTLLSEFKRAQRNEILALEHRHRLEMKEVEELEKADLRRWDAAAETRKAEKFETTRDVYQRRIFLDQMERDRKKFIEDQGIARQKREAEQKQLMRKIQARQKENLTKFEEYLARGEKPPADVWP